MMRKRVGEATRAACGAIALISKMGRKANVMMVIQETRGRCLKVGERRVDGGVGVSGDLLGRGRMCRDLCGVGGSFGQVCLFNGGGAKHRAGNLAFGREM